jgi:hypothetical protein
MDVFFRSIYWSLKTTHGCFFLVIYLCGRQHMEVFSFHSFKSEDNTWMFFPIYLSLKTTDVFFHLLKSEENTWIFFPLYLLKSEEYTSMFFFPFTEVWRQHMNVSFSIYLSLKTTHGCFCHLRKPKDNTWMFFFPYT